MTFCYEYQNSLAHPTEGLIKTRWDMMG